MILPEGLTVTIITSLTEKVIRELAPNWGEQARCVLRLPSEDDKLLHLNIGLASVAAYATPPRAQEDLIRLRTLLTDALRDVASFAMIWVEMDTARVAEPQVKRERERQRQLFRDRKISFDVASLIIDPRRKFRALAEEVGEVAHAIDQIENHDMAAGNLHMELIQVAAVAVAWLESMEVQS